MRTRNIFRARNFVLGVLLVSVTASAPQQAPAQNAPESMIMPAFAPPMLEHMRKMRRYKDPDHGAQPTPHVIDRFTVDSDPKGAIASFQPNGAPNIGHHSVKAPLHIGVPDAAEKAPPVLDIAGLPVFTITCKLKDGPLAGKVYKVTDPGRAMISGKCKDIGRFKGPILHGLAARALG